jgi:hypothetical protein
MQRSRPCLHPSPSNGLSYRTPWSATKSTKLRFYTRGNEPKRNISLTKLAKLMGMHRDTLRNYMKLYRIDRQFTALSNSDLDLLVKHFKNIRPQSGMRYLISFLRTRGVRVQKVRLAHSMARVDRVGREMRNRTTIRRRKYKAKRPNYCWHLDGHHKLILWGIVIHGIVDGYCRTVCLDSMGIKSDINGSCVGR